MKPSGEDGAGPRDPHADGRAPARVHAHARARARSTTSSDITTGWEAASCVAGAHEGPSEAERLDWLPARVPGTAAGALRDAGAYAPGDARDFDAEDWWFRTRFDAERAEHGEQAILHLGGIATVAEVHLNGERILCSESMFERHALDVGELLRGSNELAIRCRALGPLLAERRRPRARWRTKLVAEGNLRFFRTMLLGRAPGFAPGPAAVGPWRAVALERRRGIAVEDARVRTRVQGNHGTLRVRALLRGLDGEVPAEASLELTGPSGAHSAALDLSTEPQGTRVEGELTLADPALWWPHTHGEPALYDACLHVRAERAAHVVELGRVGFRTITAGAHAAHEVERDGLQLHVNGVRVFARGAVWTPVDFVSMAPSGSELRAALEQAREAGMNMLRIPGTSAYETREFHDLCDELGFLLWQDMMFANFDYPLADASFRAHVVREANEVLDELGGRPSTAVICGNSEIEQQVAMLGLDPAMGRGELFGELLPGIVGEHDVDATYVPSAPCGGDQPFRPDRGIANYYGVGGYRRPLEDARRAGVRFAAECLALSNVPGEETLAQMLPQAPASLVAHHPRWKQGVPRDAGSGWDFEDVRDHYLSLLFGLEAAELRRTDHDRYLELSRVTSGEVMAEVLGEWRRPASGCGGGMVLWLRDLLPGAGWGLIDSRGEPKAALHHVRRACEPVAVWMSDEGLGGLVAHVANDRPARLRARLRAALYRDHEHLVEQAEQEVDIAAHGSAQWNVEELLGHFVDAGWAYRFGPPQQDLVVATLQTRGGELISQSMRFPAGRPRRVETLARLGASASLRVVQEGRLRAHVTALRLLYGVRMHVRGYRPAEDSFCVEPGAERTIDLHPCASGRDGDGPASEPQGYITAVNATGRIPLALESEQEQRVAPRSEEARV
jgi:beta-mannosidase